MSEAYKVSVELELEDKFSPELSKAIKALKEAGDTLAKFPAGLKDLSADGRSLAESLHKAAEAAGEFGKAGGLATGVKHLERMATASAAIARNIQAAVRSGEHLGSGFLHRSSGSGASVRASRVAGKEVEEKGAEGEGGESLFSSVSDKASESFIDKVNEGFRANLDLEEINKKIALAMNIPAKLLQKKIAELRDEETGLVSEYGDVTGGEVAPIAQSRLAVTYVLRYRNPEAQEQMFKLVMPHAAHVAREQGMELPEATKGLLNIVEVTNTTDSVKAGHLINAVDTAMHASGASLDQMQDGLHDAPKVFSSEQKNLNDAALLVGMLKQKGMLDPDSGRMLTSMSETTLQTRIKTATDGYLDLISYDFFGASLPRLTLESDNAFRARILANLFVRGPTRGDMIKVLTLLTGAAPTVFEPGNTTDSGGWDDGFHWDAGGAAGGGWGDPLPYQSFVTAYRPPGSLISLGEWDVYRFNFDANAWWSDNPPSSLTDAAIVAAVEATRVLGTIVWLRIADAPVSP